MTLSAHQGQLPVTKTRCTPHSGTYSHTADSHKHSRSRICATHEANARTHLEGARTVYAVEPSLTCGHLPSGSLLPVQGAGVQMKPLCQGLT